MNRLSRLAMAVVLAAAPGVADKAAAQLILYEGFGDYDAGLLTGQAVGANTIGLDKTANWISNNDITWEIVPTGLTIGSGATALATTPGAVVHRNGSSVVAAQLDLESYQGTLYSSYLVSIDHDVNTPGVNGVVFIVIGEEALNNANRRFRQLAKNAGGETPVGVSYINGATAGQGRVDTVEQSNTTFMILSRFTHVGEAVDAATPGVADLWALSSDQFDHFKAAGFAGIDSAAVGSASDQVTGWATHSFSEGTRALDSTLHLQLATALGAGRPYPTFDEVRMGSSFDAVTPAIPEPAAATLALAIACSLGAVRRAAMTKST